MDIKILMQELSDKGEYADEVKVRLRDNNVFLINVMGSPGAGKTSLIIELIKSLRGEFNIAVVEGDIAGKVDAEKIDALGIPVIQLNLNGACHIEPLSIKTILGYFDLVEIDIIFIENIGNLVCPAEFDIGEDMKIAVLSIPEGDDKVEKYPLLFAKSDVLVLNKYDMMEYFEFQDSKVVKDTRELNETSNIFRISTRTGREVDDLSRDIRNRITTKYN
ncbi:MAG: hydrogenase nickel incorporation protein HypB [Clostridium sp.]